MYLDVASHTSSPDIQGRSAMSTAATEVQDYSTITGRMLKGNATANGGGATISHPAVMDIGAQQSMELRIVAELVSNIEVGTILSP